jgi:hypothetical protein
VGLIVSSLDIVTMPGASDTRILPAHPGRNAPSREFSLFFNFSKLSINEFDIAPPRLRRAVRRIRPTRRIGPTFARGRPW